MQAADLSPRRPRTACARCCTRSPPTRTCARRSRPAGWSRSREAGGWPIGEFVAPSRASRRRAKKDGHEGAREAVQARRRSGSARRRERREREAARKREEAERRKLERRLTAAREQADEAKQRLEAAQEAYESATHEVARIEEQLS